MFENWFAKYARAVSNERDRKWLYDKYRARTITGLIFIALCVALIVFSIVLSPYIEQNWALTVMFIIILAWFGFGIAALCLWVSFKRTFNQILKSPAEPDEMPEVTSYRQKTAEDKKTSFKKLWWAWLVFALGVVGFIACMAVEFIKNPDGDDFTVWGNAAVWILLVGAVTLALAYVFYNSFKRQNGNAVEQQTAEEAKAIDAAQGRKTEYNLQSDPNLQTYKYLFPNKKLREQAEQLRKDYDKISAFGIIFIMVAVVVVIVFLHAFKLISEAYSGYLVAGGLTVLFVGIVLFMLLIPQRRKLAAIEREQKAEMQTLPELSKNLEWYTLYTNFYKFKGKIYLIFVLLGLALSWVFAALFPSTAWSVTGIILIIIGLAVNNYLVKGLRQTAMPIEAEIDRIELQNAAKDDEVEQTDESE